MKAIAFCAVVIVTLALVGSHVVAQQRAIELIPTPDPIGGARIDAGVPAPLNSSAGATAAGPKDSWRYRWYNGRWWYWTARNRWMWYGDDGHWIVFDANNPPPIIRAPGNPPGYYSPAPGYYDPGPAYSTGYYPGVGVGVGPYGNVGVGVGRRIGVDVAGPHGNVRVGRINVGW
jgi:hypothetical protein